jgi:hypothetical protein
MSRLKQEDLLPAIIRFTSAGLTAVINMVQVRQDLHSGTQAYMFPFRVVSLSAGSMEGGSKARLQAADGGNHQ